MIDQNGKDEDQNRMADALAEKDRPAKHNKGLVDWLLACPEKDFFTPIESESTDTIRELFSHRSFKED